MYKYTEAFKILLIQHKQQYNDLTKTETHIVYYVQPQCDSFTVVLSLSKARSTPLIWCDTLVHPEP